MKMQRMRSKLSLLSLCLGFAGGPALAQQAEASPEAAQAPEAAQTAASPAEPAAAAAPAAPAAPFTPPPPPDLRLYYAQIDFLRYNPIGIESQHRLILQKRLSDNSASPMMRDSYLNGAAVVKLNPAGMKVGPAVEFQPLTLLNVRATYEYCRFFGAFGFLQSYPGPNFDFSDDRRSLTEDSAYATGGHHYMVEPSLQTRLGAFLLRTKTSIEYWDIDLRDGDGGTFYDPLLDTLVPGQGWVFTNDTDVIMLLSPQLSVGARFSGVWPRYDDGGAGTTLPDNSHQRVGVLASYAFHTRERTAFNRPTVFVNLAWFVNHPSRQEALPYIGTGFSFTSDIMSMD